MTTFSVKEFEGLLKFAEVNPEDVDEVISAWGQRGVGSEWTGGFFVVTRNHQWAYLWGWCDEHGMNCKGEGHIKRFNHVPSITSIVEFEEKNNHNLLQPIEFDFYPSRLNSFLKLR